MSRLGKAKSIAIVPLTETVALTLAKDRRGWRFVDWVADDARRPAPPTEEDRHLRFSDTEAATSYLRRFYGQRLR